jgi:hypothetical protein
LALESRRELNRLFLSSLALASAACVRPGTTPEDGIAARAVDGGWEILTFDSRYVCQDVGPDLAGEPTLALGAMKVARDGKAAFEVVSTALAA